MIDGVSRRSHRRTRLLRDPLLVILIVLAASCAADGWPGGQGDSPRPCLRAGRISDLAQSLASLPDTGDLYAATIDLAFANSAGTNGLTAFEENRSFVYALGPAASYLNRRLIILKPSVFIVDDQTLSGPEGPAATCLYSLASPELAGGRATIVEGKTRLFWETPAPQRVTYRATHQLAGQPEPRNYVVEALKQDHSAGNRSLNVFYTVGTEQTTQATHSELIPQGDYWKLTVSAGGRSFRLTLPPPGAGAGQIAIFTAEGETLVGSRPLPSGILPHGPKGNLLLESWDKDYRGNKPPAWDIGRPSDELQKLVKEGTVRACRAVDLGCGSGTDAIFLASHGFDVTAIDISPTALSQAEEKARKAGVSVRWILADVVAPPNVGSFDFVYDRGCYHNVRDQNLTAYVDTVRRLSHPGTRFLLLSARRAEQASKGSAGVTEEELRYDFLSLFDVEWLREIRLESNEPGVTPPGWSALLIRNAQP